MLLTGLVTIILICAGRSEMEPDFDEELFLHSNVDCALYTTQGTEIVRKEHGIKGPAYIWSKDNPFFEHVAKEAEESGFVSTGVAYQAQRNAVIAAPAHAALDASRMLSAPESASIPQIAGGSASEDPGGETKEEKISDRGLILTEASSALAVASHQKGVALTESIMRGAVMGTGALPLSLGDWEEHTKTVAFKHRRNTCTGDTACGDDAHWVMALKGIEADAKAAKAAAAKAAAEGEDGEAAEAVSAGGSGGGVGRGLDATAAQRRALWEWVTAKGGKLGFCEEGRGADGRRALVATEDVRGGDVVLSVPSAVALSKQSMGSVSDSHGSVVKHFEALWEKGAEYGLVACLVHEMNKWVKHGHGKFGPLLDSLRMRLLSRGVRKELRGTHGEALLMRWHREATNILIWTNRHVCKEYRAKLACDGFTVEAFRWALLTVRQFAVRVTKATTGTSFLALVPYANLLRHTPGAKGRVTLSLDGRIVFALSAHQEGDSLGYDKGNWSDTETFTRTHALPHTRVADGSGTAAEAVAQSAAKAAAKVAAAAAKGDVAAKAVQAGVAGGNAHAQILVDFEGLAPEELIEGIDTFWDLKSLRSWRMKAGLPPRISDVWSAAEQLGLMGDDEYAEMDKVNKVSAAQVERLMLTRQANNEAHARQLLLGQPPSEAEAAAASREEAAAMGEGDASDYDMDLTVEEVEGYGDHDFEENNGSDGDGDGIDGDDDSGGEEDDGSNELSVWSDGGQRTRRVGLYAVDFESEGASVMKQGLVALAAAAQQLKVAVQSGAGTMNSFVASMESADEEAAAEAEADADPLNRDKASGAGEAAEDEDAARAMAKAAARAAQAAAKAQAQAAAIAEASADGNVSHVNVDDLSIDGLAGVVHGDVAAAFIMRKLVDFFLRGTYPGGGLDKLDLMLMKKWKLIQQVCPPAREHKLTMAGPSPALLCSLRLHLTNETELSVLCPLKRDRMWWDSGCEGDIAWYNISQPLSPRNERLTLAALRNLMRALLQDYGSSEEEDADILRMEGRDSSGRRVKGPIAMAAVRMRSRERQLLWHNLAVVSGWETRLQHLVASVNATAGVLPFLCHRRIWAMKDGIREERHRQAHIDAVKEAAEVRAVVVDIPVNLNGDMVSFKVREGDNLEERATAFAIRHRLTVAMRDALIQQARQRAPTVPPLLLALRVLSPSGEHLVLRVPHNGNLTTELHRFCIVHDLTPPQCDHLSAHARHRMAALPERRVLLTVPVAAPDGRQLQLQIRQGEQHELTVTAQQFARGNRMDPALAPQIAASVDRLLPPPVMRIPLQLPDLRPFQLRVARGDDPAELVNTFFHVHNLHSTGAAPQIIATVGQRLRAIGAA